MRSLSTRFVPTVLNVWLCLETGPKSDANGNHAQISEELRKMFEQLIVEIWSRSQGFGSDDEDEGDDSHENSNAATSNGANASVMKPRTKWLSRLAGRCKVHFVENHEVNIAKSVQEGMGMVESIDSKLAKLSASVPMGSNTHLSGSSNNTPPHHHHIHIILQPLEQTPTEQLSTHRQFILHMHYLDYAIRSTIISQSIRVTDTDADWVTTQIVRTLGCALEDACEDVRIRVEKSVLNKWEQEQRVKRELVGGVQVDSSVTSTSSSKQ